MSGAGFVQAVAVWLVLLALGAFLTVVAVVNDGVWVIVLAFALVWVPLTMRWVWLMFRGGA